MGSESPVAGCNQISPVLATKVPILMPIPHQRGFVIKLADRLRRSGLGGFLLVSNCRSIGVSSFRYGWL